MKKLATATTLAFLLATAALPAAAQYRHGPRHSDNSLRLHGGLFEPDGESAYWSEKEQDFTGGATGFEDVILGIDYMHRLGGRLGVVIGGSAFEGQEDQSYRAFVDSFGDPIFHTTTLQLTTATLGLSVDLASSRSPVVPYVGIGGGLYAWDLEESGEFVDFATDPLEIFPATFQDDGVVFGWYAMAGLDVPIGPSWSLFAEARWHNAEDDLEGDFADLGKLDLGGRQITAGVSWRF